MVLLLPPLIRPSRNQSRRKSKSRAAIYKAEKFALRPNLLLKQKDHQMTDTTQASTSAAAPAATNAIDTFFANIKKDWQVFEGDVIAVCHNIEAGIEVAAEDLTYSLSWLGSHARQVAPTVAGCRARAPPLPPAGFPTPASRAKGIAQLNDASVGVNAALNNQAVSANAS